MRDRDARRAAAETAQKSKAADVLQALKDRGWRAGDFKDRWGHDDMERAVDRALQFHRVRKMIYSDTRIGWRPSVQSSAPALETDPPVPV